jgi:hypothetical protein
MTTAPDIRNTSAHPDSDWVTTLSAARLAACIRRNTVQLWDLSHRRRTESPCPLTCTRWRDEIALALLGCGHRVPEVAVAKCQELPIRQCRPGRSWISQAGVRHWPCSAATNCCLIRSDCPSGQKLARRQVDRTVSSAGGSAACRRITNASARPKIWPTRVSFQQRRGNGRRPANFCGLFEVIRRFEQSSFGEWHAEKFKSERQAVAGKTARHGQRLGATRAGRVLRLDRQSRRLSP